MNLLGKIKGYVIITGLVLSCPGELVSQHRLLYKDGTLEMVHVVYKHQDTLKFHLPREKYTLHTVLLDSIAGFGITTSAEGPLWDTVPGIHKSSGVAPHEIIFTTGVHEKGLVLYMTPEIMKYRPYQKRAPVHKKGLAHHMNPKTMKQQLYEKSSFVMTVPSDQVDYFGYRPAKDTSGWDTSYAMKGYKHYMHSGILGAVFSAAGAALTTTGIIIIGNATHNSDEFFGDTYDVQVGFGAFVTTIGGGFFLAGMILNITSWPKMQIYKKKTQGFSFDLHHAPGINGLSLRYHF